MNNPNPSSYIVAATSTTTTSTSVTTTLPNGAIDSPTGPTLSDIKLICVRRKKKTKRHIYVTFVEDRPLTSTNDQASIEVVNKSNNSTQPSTSYPLSECLSFEYFDTVKNDFQSFIHVYFQSYTISIYFSDDQFEKKAIIIKHLENMHRSKSESNSEINNNNNNNPNNPSQEQQQQIPIQPASQQTMLPCSSTTENILHTFDVQLIPYGPIISRDHALVGPARLYFTTTDLYITSINCNRTDLRVTITNQCPSKEKEILCIPYFTIKNYGNRSNIFLIELGKSTYGNGEIHMKCRSSSLASTIHLLVSPVIEERPLILSSAFQNQLLTHKRMEKSKNIHPPIQLNNETNNPSIFDSPVSSLQRKSAETLPPDTQSTPTRSNDIKSRLVVGFFRSLTKNIAHLRRSATFHHNNCNNSNQSASSPESNGIPKNKSVLFNIDETLPSNDQHQIILPESQKKNETTTTTASAAVAATTTTVPAPSAPIVITKQTSDSLLVPISTNKMGTYIDMGPTTPKTSEEQKDQSKDETTVQETAATTVDVGVNTIISLSPRVRSAIIVGNSVHLIADEKTLFPIGQRSFTSPASVMQPFKTQLTGQTTINSYAPSTDVLASSPNSCNSLHQPNSASNSQQSLLLSYGIVTFNNNNNSTNTDLTTNDPNERATSPPSDSSTLDRRLNSDLSLLSMNQQQASISNIYPFDSVLSSSSSHIFRTLSVSATNIGETFPGQLRTPRGSIIFFDDHLNEQATTYLLGPPTSLPDDSIPASIPRLSSFNLTSSMSRSHLSHIDEEKTSSHDPYAFVEPLTEANSDPFISTIPLGNASQSVDYADLLPLCSHGSNDYSESNDQPTTSNLHSDDQIDSSNDNHQQEEDEQQQLLTNQRSSTLLYTDIDFHQTRRRDRIAQFAAKAKLDDQTPPFVL